MTESPSDPDPAAQDADREGADPDLVDQVSEILPGAWNEEEHLPSKDDGDEDEDDARGGPGAL